MKRVVPGLVVVGLLVSGCSGDPTASEEYEELEDQLAAAQQQSDAMTATAIVRRCRNIHLLI